MRVLITGAGPIGKPLYAGWRAIPTPSAPHLALWHLCTLSREFRSGCHLIALAVMLPATFLAGMTLPLFTHVLLSKGAGEKAIGRIYAANTLGAIVGVMFAIHVGLPLLGLKSPITLSPRSTRISVK